MCRAPVTFGGGMTMEYGTRPSGSLWPKFFAAQKASHLACASFGSYALADSVAMHRLLTRSVAPGAAVWERWFRRLRPAIRFARCSRCEGGQPSGDGRKRV